MNFIPADTISLVIFSLFCIFMFSLVFYALGKSSQSTRLRLIFVVMLSVFGFLVLSGFLERHLFPMVPLIMIGGVLVAVGLSVSPVGREIGAKFSLPLLVGFQSFRFFLELILHHWAKLGTVPETMTWTGQNWDVVSGFLALVSIPFLSRSKILTWVVQWTGFLLLLNVFRVVIYSSPFPFAWQLTHPLQLIFHFPYAFILPLFVMPALVGHLLVFTRSDTST
jgi:hypothetical protein